MTLEAAIEKSEEIWETFRNKEAPEGYDNWIAIDDVWDLNIYEDGLDYAATLYPVVEGKTKTSSPAHHWKQ